MTFLSDFRRYLRLGSITLLLVLAVAPSAEATAPPDGGDASRIAAARDKVLPVVVSILVVREDFRQGEPTLSLSSGSGTVVSPEGHVATNAHVTEHGKSFRVIFADGRELPARLVGRDTLTDLAVLQVEPPTPETFAYASFAETLDLRAGDTVLAMGAPWGLSNSMSAGVVNNPRRLLVSLFDDESDYEDSLGDDEPTGRYYAWIQHDASIAPGNSGGPLVDLQGRIVGVNTRGMIVGGDLAFAIPAPDAAAVVRELIKSGSVTRVSLGFRLRSLKGSGFDRGVLVSAIDRDSDPDKAGLRAGDRVLSINGQPVDAPLPVDVPGLQEKIAELPVDSKVRLHVDRAGKPLDFTLVAKAIPRERDRQAEIAGLGLSARRLSEEAVRHRHVSTGSGVVVAGVRPGGPAATARPEISPGDVITGIDGHPVASVDDLTERLASQPASIVVSIEDDGEQRLSVLRPEFGDQGHSPVPELPKAWAGVAVQPFTGTLAHDAGLPGPGFRISRIYPGSPLAAAGAKVGDLLTALEGNALRPVNDSNSSGFDERVRDIEPGTQVRFDGVRAGKPVHFDCKLGVAPVDAGGLTSLAEPQLGAQLRDLGFYDRVALSLPAATRGVFVEGVEGGGAAGLAHMQRADVITAIGGQQVTDPRQFKDVLAQVLAESSRAPIPILVVRGDQTRILYLERYWLKSDSKESP